MINEDTSIRIDNNIISLQSTREKPVVLLTFYRRLHSICIFQIIILLLLCAYVQNTMNDIDQTENTTAYPGTPHDVITQKR